MHRLFVAISLPEAVTDRLLDLQNGMRGARWLPDENFHLTLAFIGEVDRHGLNDVALALGGISAPRFDLRLKGCSFFGDRKPRALWVGAEPNPHLSHLQSKVGVALARAGFVLVKRKFTPHVTLARLKDTPLHRVSSFLAHNSLFRAGPIPIGHFTLFSSFHQSSGAIYTAEPEYFLEPTV